MPMTSKTKRQIEQALQKACVHMLDIYIHNYALAKKLTPEQTPIRYKINNEQTHGKAFIGSIYKLMGLQAGIPDLHFIRDKDFSCYFEFKEPKGSLTKSQKIMIPRLRALGHIVHIVDNIDSFESIIKDILH